MGDVCGKNLEYIVCINGAEVDKPVVAEEIIIKNKISYIVKLMIATHIVAIQHHILVLPMDVHHIV